MGLSATSATSARNRLRSERNRPQQGLRWLLRAVALVLRGLRLDAANWSRLVGVSSTASARNGCATRDATGCCALLRARWFPLCTPLPGISKSLSRACEGERKIEVFCQNLRFQHLPWRTRV